MRDVFYTPRALALAMVASVRKRKVTAIADFASGDGELLRAAAERWPDARLIAGDIDANVVRRVRRREPGWFVTCSDFLNGEPESRKFFASRLGNVSVVFLNPPFSNRGARRFLATIRGENVYCSQGLAFVGRSLGFLEKSGEVVAILPAGTLTSEMDIHAWSVIKAHYSSEVLDRFDDRTFQGCLPKTVLVRVRWKRSVQRTNQSVTAVEIARTPALREIKVRLMRGKVDMTKSYGASLSRLPLLHTTELHNGAILLGKRFCGNVEAEVTGPAVLLPRVGRPSVGKICRLPGGTSAALSNCVIAICCASEGEAVEVHARLVGKWRQVCEMYVGTCASYTTLEILKNILGMIRVNVIDMEANCGGSAHRYDQGQQRIAVC